MPSHDPKISESGNLEVSQNFGPVSVADFSNSMIQIEFFGYKLGFFGKFFGHISGSLRSECRGIFRGREK